MRQVARGNLSTPAAVAQRVGDLCDASQQVTEEIADAYTIIKPAGFTPVRTLDLTVEPTAAQVGAVLATFLLDMQQRGVTKRSASV